MLSFISLTDSPPTVRVDSNSNVLNLRFFTKLTQDFAMLPTAATIFAYSPASNIFGATVFIVQVVKR
ncbi:hypothetical protein FB451DRAFT_1394085 [Mycena latifolia]|nr:hypothetical protein FB451DRAFT_1394085 [Mycena latifolia]